MDFVVALTQTPPSVHASLLLSFQPFLPPSFHVFITPPTPWSW